MTTPSVLTVTGSKKIDTAVFLAVLGLMVCLALRLRVYYQVTVVEVTVQRISADGSRTALPTPHEFMHAGAGYWPGKAVVPNLKPLINNYMAHSDWLADSSPGTRFQWNIRWSEDSLKLDQSDRIIWERPDGELAH